MKILWFPGNGAIYANTNKYNGGGWTASLATELIRNCSDLSLGMAIPWNSYFKEEKNGVIFYGIPQIKYGAIGYKQKLSIQLGVIKSIIDDFTPDLIHLFGSEHSDAMVTAVTNVPVVLHIQGILNVCLETWLPYNLSWEKFMLWHPRQFFHYKSLIRSCALEKEIFRHCKYYMGRTDMDMRLCSLLSPNSKYYVCNEMLRPEIYQSNKVWQYHSRNRKKIVSVISSPIYKGGDIILRVANILKKLNFQYEWEVYGVQNMRDWERLSGIESQNVNVNVKGVVTAYQLVESIIDSDVFVHPSYIENSSNTICEAQLLGVPVIANNVGGISSLIKHEETGILVPANDIYKMTSYIIEMFNDKEKASIIGQQARESALKRHKPDEIVKCVINIYRDIIPIN